MSTAAIQVTDLTKRFGDTLAVDHVSLTMPEGAVWGFLGPNGSGKTTTIRMMCGLLTPTSGHGACLGYDILTQSAEIKRRTGYMTQKFSFWSDLTIRENIEFVARLYGLDNRHRVVRETLDGLGLTRRQHQAAGALSGGWKQRLALAAVTMHKPRLLLLDEPTAGVDPEARREFWDEIHRLAATGLTVLVSTHYMDEAERCDRIVYLAHGRLVTEGRVDEIIKQSGLITLRGEGEGARQFAEKIKHSEGVTHAAYFGSALHISGDSQALLEQAAAKAGSNITWRPVRPSLDDAFISLAARIEDQRFSA